MTVKIQTIGQITFLVADSDIAAKAEFNLESELTSEQFSNLINNLSSKIQGEVSTLEKESKDEIEKLSEDFFPDEEKPKSPTKGEVSKAVANAEKIFKGKTIVPEGHEEMGVEGVKLLIKDYIAQTDVSRDEAKAYVRAMLERAGCNYEDDKGSTKVYGLDADTYMKVKSQISKLKKADK